MRYSRQAGFTLIELLVAMFITAIMFVIGYRALEQALSSRHLVDAQSARLIAVQQALRIVEQDFELLQPRPVRNLIGDGYLPAMMTSLNAGSMLGSTAPTLGDAGSTNPFPSLTLGNVTSLNGAAMPLLSFTRGGWTNPAGLPRSELQRVSYAIENG